MKIQVLGSGCPTCKKLYELTLAAVKQLQLEASVEYVTDVSKIIEMGVMASPVLAIDGQPALSGFLPDIGQIKSQLIKGAAAAEIKNSVSKCGNCG